MKVTDAFPSKWLAASDIPDDGLTVTIDNYELETVGQGDKKQTKPILYFQEDIKPMILNKTNAKAIEDSIGSDDLDDWVGKKIKLIAREVEFQGETVWAIRISIPRRTVRPVAATAPATPQHRAATQSAARGKPGTPSYEELPPQDPNDNVPF